MAMQARVAALEHALTERAPAGWWVAVLWRFRNLAQQPLYVLSRGPLSIVDGDPVVLNHTLSGHPVVDPYAEPEIEFAAIPLDGHLDLRRSYPFPPLDPQTGRLVVGRFAASFDQPDPDWPRTKPWETLEQWQRLLESSPFDLG
jgi:hypothetical protein